MLTRRDFVLGAAGSSLLGRASVGRAQSPTELTSLSLEEASRLIRSRRISSLDLTNACLARIHTYEPLLNAFITITEEDARYCAGCSTSSFGAVDGAGRCTAFRSH